MLFSDGVLLSMHGWKLTPSFYSWCRSRDLNPDERNSLPPQDSVSTISTTSAFLYHAVIDPHACCRLYSFVNTRREDLSNENKQRLNTGAIWPAAERPVQVVRSHPSVRASEAEPPVAQVARAWLFVRLRPWMRPPSPIFLYGPRSKTGSAT